MLLIPIFFGCALFISIYSVTCILSENTSGESGRKHRKIFDGVPIVLLTSATLSLLLRNASVVPFALLFFSSVTALHQRKKQGQLKTRLNREIPFIALSLSLLIEAGCSIQSAIDTLRGSYPKSPAKNFLGDVKSLFDLGVDTARGMDEISRTYQSERADLLLELLMTGKALGSGPAKALKQISDKMISDRVIDAEERALKAPVKLMVPLCLFIFPAIFILIFSPIILQLGGIFR